MKLLPIGEFLKEGYIEPSGMTLNEVASEIGTSPATLSRLLNGKSELTTELAIKLETLFGRKAETWLIHQVKYTLQEKGYYNED